MKSRIVLSLSAFLFAVVGAFVSQANTALVNEFGINTVPNPDRCETGVLQQSNCSTSNTGATCTVALASTGAIVSAFDTQASQTACASQLFQPE